MLPDPTPDDEPAVSPDPSAEPYPGVEPAPPGQNMPPESYPGQLPTPETGVEKSSAYPVVVDLSQLTPEPTDDDAPLIVVPAPGVPDPGGAIAHQLSQALAKRLDLDVSAVITVEVMAVDWPDSSLGCPAPGMAYLTVITPGYKVALEGAGQTFTYHTDLAGEGVLCGEDGRPVSD